MSPGKALTTFVLLSFFLIASHRFYQLVVADIYASVAEKKLDAKNYTAAEHYLIKSFSHSDGNPEYHHLLAQSLSAQARETADIEHAQALLRQAREHLEKSVALNPNEGNVWLDLAQTCWWLSRFPGYEPEYDNAGPFFLRALETDPNNGKFLYAMANYYLFSPKPEDCLPYLKRLAKVYPNAYPHLRGNPNWSDAFRDTFKDGLKTAVKNPLTGREALKILALMASEEEDWDSAIACVEELIRTSGADVPSDAHITLGRYCLHRQDQPRAAAAFLQALKLSKNREQTLQSLLLPCIQANALALYLDLSKETATFDTNVRNRLPLILGKAFLQAGDLGEAKLHLQQSLQAKDTPEARCYLAEIALTRKDWDAAEIESQRATILDPKNSYAYYLFARSLDAQGKYRSALEAITEAIRNARSPWEGYYAIQASLYWALKDFNGAIEASRAAHQLAPQNANHLRRIAEAYRMTNDLVKAEQYYMAAIELAPQDDLLRTELESVRRQSK